MAERISLTTTLPYVNADPHVGFALEIVQADVVARYHRLMGDDVFFNTGTDEHGQKIYQKAVEEGKDVQDYVDEYAARFELLKDRLGLSYDAFIRTTDPHHVAAAQEFWKRCEANGDIYKKDYAVKYCVGCELEKQESDLENDRCPFHPDKELEVRDEENYFFRFSKYQEQLLALYKERPDFVVPAHRLNEIRAFVERGLQDFSISRLKTKMPWGVEVPGDSEHVMYVWFDALVNYISTLGWPASAEATAGKPDPFHEWWPSVQFAGKDNLRQQSAMWQAMLMSAGIEPSKQIMIHGFINSGGQKMSKSLGNVINPIDVVDEYGTDALRYYLLRHVHPFEDSDMTMERFHECYTANLVNGVGNLTARIMKMAETHLDGVVQIPETKDIPLVKEKIESFEFQSAMDAIWSYIADLDELIQEQQPFKVVKEDKEKACKQITYLVIELERIGYALESFMPETAQIIKDAVRANKKPEIMFPRKTYATESEDQ